MDLSMPGIGGLESIRHICNQDSKVKILVFSVHDEQVYITRALTAGAKGYITKNSAPQILTEAIQKTHQGEIYIEQGLTATRSNQDVLLEKTRHNAFVDAFSPREFDIFILLAKAQTAHQIADELCLSYKTVANYSTQIKKKLRVTSLIEISQIAQHLASINH